MPVITSSNFKSSRILFNGHLETIYPALVRKVVNVSYQRERIYTEDEDFLDLDWSRVKSNALAIISHGLEGDTSRPYIKGMVKAFNQHHMDALAWNYRGCSQEMNLQRRFYHSGATDDLDFVINHVIQQAQYQEIYLIGFSLGGNITLKYLGEKGANLSQIIKASVVFSVPMHLHSSCLKISEPSNFLYSKRFLDSLIKKIKTKARIRNDISITGIQRIKSLKAFDDRYTAPLHGFENAIHYYESCSAINFLDDITCPTLIVSAKNDPFLSEECYPVEKITNHPTVYMEIPGKGGHVGFVDHYNAMYWSEKRALEFIDLKR